MNTKSRLVKNRLEDGRIFAEKKTLSGHCTVHYHDFYEIDIVLSGSGVSVCNGKSYDMHRGMITLSSPEDFHEYTADSPSGMITVQFGFDMLSANITDMLCRARENVIYADDDCLNDIGMLTELLLKRKHDRHISSRLLECVILSIKDKLFPDTNKYEKFPTPVQKAIVYIHSNFKEDIKMRDTAKRLGLCENYFSALFKKSVGVSYKEYVRNLRLCHAANLIRYNNMSVTQAALGSGYNSQSHFNRDFKNKFGVSPSSMRKEPVPD